jgi:hypothetical protein
MPDETKPTAPDEPLSRHRLDLMGVFASESEAHRYLDMLPQIADLVVLPVFQRRLSP